LPAFVYTIILAIVTSADEKKGADKKVEMVKKSGNTNEKKLQMLE